MESLVLEGRIINKLNPQEGVSTRGAWKKQEFILETAEQYPKKVCICCWNEKIDELANIQINETIRVSVNIESREFNNRWYTDVKAWRIETGVASSPSMSTPPSATNDVTGISFSDEDTDLPF